MWYKKPKKKWEPPVNSKLEKLRRLLAARALRRKLRETKIKSREKFPDVKDLPSAEEFYSSSGKKRRCLSFKLREQARRVIKNILGQDIPKGFCPHHIDEDLANYSWYNLALMPISDHSKLHVFKRGASRGLIKIRKAKKIIEDLENGKYSINSMKSFINLYHIDIIK